MANFIKKMVGKTNLICGLQVEFSKHDWKKGKGKDVGYYIFEIPHNLGRYVNVTVFEEDNTVILDVVHSKNLVKLKISEDPDLRFSGLALLIGPNIYKNITISGIIFGFVILILNHIDTIKIFFDFLFTKYF